MTGADNKQASPAKDAKKVKPREKGRKQPEWAEGLRRLYDSVVDEPLPDNFKDLLSKLDDGKP